MVVEVDFAVRADGCRDTVRWFVGDECGSAERVSAASAASFAAMSVVGLEGVGEVAPPTGASGGASGLARTPRTGFDMASSDFNC